MEDLLSDPEDDNYVDSIRLAECEGSMSEDSPTGQLDDDILLGINVPAARASLGSNNQAHPVSTPLRNYEKAHVHWFVRVILLLVAFLHTRFHVTFCACALVLFTCCQIFIGLKLLPSDDKFMPITLTTTLKHLRLDDNFTIYVVCEVCHHLHP